MLHQVAARIDSRSSYRSLTGIRPADVIKVYGERFRAMADQMKASGNSAARRLAITGALVTGVAGVAMAVFSVVLGEETGGGALLAAAALAFGLLAVNVDRTVGRASADRNIDAGLAPNSATNGSPARPTVSNGATASDEAHIDAEPLTSREREVLSFVAEGYSNKLISAELGISERTVKNHLTATMTKLRASDRTHAVVTAMRLGWLDL